MQLPNVIRDPPLWVAKKSRRRRMRRALPKASTLLSTTSDRLRRGGTARLLLVGGDSQAPTALAATVGEHFGASRGFHAGAKAVFAATAGVVGLVCALHGGRKGRSPKHGSVPPSRRGTRAGPTAARHSPRS